MYSNKKIKALLSKIKELEQKAIDTEQSHKLLLRKVHPDHALSARNLLHYLAIRASDMRKLQSSLSDLAISSHSHSESYTLNNLQKIECLLNALNGKQDEITFDTLDRDKSCHILSGNAEHLLGKATFSGQSKIMVTLPTDAADHYKLVQGMVQSGMHIARINTAHDDSKLWGKMIANIKKAEKATGKHIKIYMDIEGPKLRTCNMHHALPTSSDEEHIPSIHLQKGSKLRVFREPDLKYIGEHPAISLSLPEVFNCITKEESIWFDDGKIGGRINEKTQDYLLVEITHAPEEGYKLKEGKGINFPESRLDLPALTREDLEHLHFIAKHADMVGFSFVQTTQDVYMLQKYLKSLKREDMGIILKIETQLAFQNLPALLFAVMRSKHCGIMIARGDLAVETGYSRMAELQEEILWLAEAAHLPVVWATQVLETLVKKGTATRAEISDVVKSVRAECVMLNKGPYINEAIEMVRDIDKRMAAHEDKKHKQMRLLHVAKSFIEGPAVL